MAKRLKTKIGDIFSIPINEEEKRYMQLIAFDLNQLNSDVVRIFEKKYFHGETPSIEDIIKDDVNSYVHCAVDFGIKLNLWDKIGNNNVIGDINKIIFRDSNDYGHKEGEEPILISNDWNIWRIKDEKFTRVKKLEGENRKSYVGLVINPYGILEIAKGNEYPLNYPTFE
ncbi:hypothetical protein [Halpernia sp.]|uniref:hypothetical protein n=1 Tax=Halpernia sp. TaxID=2782209 RepID=UPI003A8D12AF